MLQQRLQRLAPRIGPGPCPAPPPRTPVPRSLAETAPRPRAPGSSAPARRHRPSRPRFGPHPKPPAALRSSCTSPRCQPSSARPRPAVPRVARSGPASRAAHAPSKRRARITPNSCAASVLRAGSTRTCTASALWLSHSQHRGLLPRSPSTWTVQRVSSPYTTAAVYCRAAISASNSPSKRPCACQRARRPRQSVNRHLPRHRPQRPLVHERFP